MFVGRWKDGTPLAVSPSAPDVTISGDEMAENFFGFAANSRDVPIAPSKDVITKNVMGYQRDFFGVRCPRFAHIRKVNPRDLSTDRGPANLTRSFLMLRRGIPYGPAFVPGSEVEDRGLLFLGYQTSIVNQFESVNNGWVNNRDAPETGGYDMLIGQTASGRSCEFLNGMGVVLDEVRTASRWVTPTGGGFFFAPAVSRVAALSA